MLNKAIEIAAKAHDGQLDKGGRAYILHPLRVMLNCESETARICAVLHDVIEDTPVTFGDLKDAGFSDEVLAVLDCLTKREGETYDEFIGRILPNETACRVKFADLTDNMDLTRIKNPSEKDKERVQKYERAVDRILEALPCSDAIPDRRLIKIDGVAEIHPAISEEKFCDMFLCFMEAHGWLFGGGFEDITDKEDEA